MYQVVELYPWKRLGILVILESIEAISSRYQNPNGKWIKYDVLAV